MSNPDGIIISGCKNAYVGGTDRYYRAFNEKQGQPLVFFLHGVYRSGADMQVDSSNLFNDLAIEKGFTAIYPDAKIPIWDDLHVTDYSSYDVEFIQAIIAKYNPSSVSVVGLSNGGSFTYRLLCGGYIDNVVCVASLLWDDVTIIPNAGSKFLLIHGTDDSLFPYAGGATAILDGSDTAMPYVYGGTCLSASATISALQSAGVTCELDTISGGGHQWFSGKEAEIIDFLFS